MAATANAIIGSAGKAACKRLMDRLAARRVQFIQLSDSNALQSTGSHWAGFRNALRTRGVPNWGTAPHGQNSGSWGAETSGDGATANPLMFSSEYDGYLRTGTAPVVLLPEDRASLPADLKKRTAFMKGEVPWSSGTAPSFAASGGGSSYTLTPNGYHGFIYGVHVNNAEDGVADQDAQPLNNGVYFSAMTPTGGAVNNTQGIASSRLEGGVWKLDQAIEFRGLYRRADTAGAFYAGLRGGSFVLLDSISVAAGAADSEWVAYTLSAAANAAFTTDGTFRPINVLPSYGTTITRKTFLTPGQFSRPDLTAGFACGCMWAEGGKSLGDCAHLLYWLTQQTGREYAIQDYLYRLLIGAGGDCDVCLHVRHKGNDYAQSTNSITSAGAAGPANNTVTGYTTNLTTVCSIIYSAWTAMLARYGISGPQLYIIDGGYHPQYTGATARNTYQQDCSEAAATLFESNPAWNAFAIDAQQYITPQEMFDGVGAGTLFKTAVSNEAHLSTEGYREVNEREWDSMVLAAALAGAGGPSRRVGLAGLGLGI